MKKQCKHRRGAWGLAIRIVAVFGLFAGFAHAQSLKINTRPLTPQEIKDYGLPADTQVANGTHVVGLGQPVYLELFLGNDDVVSNITWSLDSIVDEDGDPIASGATLTNSPINMSIPPFDAGDIERIDSRNRRNGFEILDRKMIIPDLKGTYTVSAQVETSGGILNASLDVVGSVFISKEHYLCVLCHATKMPGFNATDHAQAFKNQITGAGSDHFASYCIKCHVTGYDSAPGAVNGGFDDIAAAEGWTFPAELSTNNWDDMPVALQNISNIQCENCHGPADEHVQSLGDTSKIAVSLSAGNCGQCHDALTHHYKVEEWEQTPHANGYVFRASGSCAQCHSTKGFIDANDPGMNELDEIVATKGTGNEGITCAACHDPHSPGASAHQLRTIESVTLANGFEITQGGDGLICMACHHDRYEANDRAGQGRTPHHGTQSDLLFGQNAIEYGQDLPSSRHGDVVEDTCVQCHMQDVGHAAPAYAEHKVGGHSFALAYDDGTNAPVYLTETCTSCHGEIEDFDFGGEDYDLDGVVEGVQSEVTDMMAELTLLLENEPSGEKFNKANYNLAMVIDDGSHGVHNPKYIAAILRSSIDDLKGGIDIDNDGLLDEWEIAVFGSLTLQSGTDDYDDDGLSNIVEQNLGTNAKLADSDGDGLTDRVEVQGGSNPLDLDSVLTNDLVMLPAIELAYLPKGTGTTVNIQVINSLSDGSWTNVGQGQVSDGNWVFQLDSVQETTNRFYRAIEE